MFNSKDVEREYEYRYRQVQDIEDYKHPLINFSDVIKAHYFLADYFLDISSDSIEKMSVGVKSYHLLGSALSRQIVSYQGRMKYSNPIDICSTLFYGLVTDHPFVDGNKRTALLVLLYQLQLYGYYPNTEINKFEKLVISVAERSIQQKYRMIYKKFKKETDVDAEVLTISYIIKRLTDKVDRSFHLNLTTKEFCDTLKSIGVDFTLDNSKIKFTFTKKRFRSKTKHAYSIKFYGWTRPVEAGMVRDVFDALNLTEDYPSYKSLFNDNREPFYKLIKDFEGPLKRLKDK